MKHTAPPIAKNEQPNKKIIEQHLQMALAIHHLPISWFSNIFCTAYQILVSTTYIPPTYFQPQYHWLSETTQYKWYAIQHTIYIYIYLYIQTASIQHKLQTTYILGFSLAMLSTFPQLHSNNSNRYFENNADRILYQQPQQSTNYCARRQ